MVIFKFFKKRESLEFIKILIKIFFKVTILRLGNGIFPFQPFFLQCLCLSVNFSEINFFFAIRQCSDTHRTPPHITRLEAPKQELAYTDSSLSVPVSTVV